MTSARLGEAGVGPGLARGYAGQGWLTVLGTGAYARAQDNVSWAGGLYALQQEKVDRFHAGGRTALELLGYGHYASVREREVFVFGPPKSKLPAWFAKRHWGPRLVFCATALIPFSLAQSFTSHQVGSFAVRISTPERAALEMLHHVPGKVDFHEAAQIMAGLGTLRPGLVQGLLETCNSIKAKRLFLYLAREAGHRWYHGLDAGRVCLGKGKRAVVKGGRLDKGYKITVPRRTGGEEAR